MDRDTLASWYTLLTKPSYHIRDRIAGVRSGLVEARTKLERELLAASLATVEMYLDCLIEDVENEVEVRSDELTRIDNDHIRMLLDRLERWLRVEAKYLHGRYRYDKEQQALALILGIQDVRRNLLVSDRPITTTGISDGS